MSIYFEFPALEITEDETFSQTEAPQVIEKFVCAVCWEELQIVYILNEARVLIVCPEHGSVCHVGRVTRNTVSIQYEVASMKFKSVIHNVDEWRCLIPPKAPPRPVGQCLAELGF